MHIDQLNHASHVCIPIYSSMRVYNQPSIDGSTGNAWNLVEATPTAFAISACSSKSCDSKESTKQDGSHATHMHSWGYACLAVEEALAL